MANRKKEVYRPKPMTEGKRNIIHALLQEYDITNAEDIQNALKDLLSGTVKEMPEFTEIISHTLGKYPSGIHDEQGENVKLFHRQHNFSFTNRYGSVFQAKV